MSYTLSLINQNSWQSERAVKYREAEGITGLLGTAVTVQVGFFC